MLKSVWSKYTLRFFRPSKTSREVLETKDTYFIKIWDDDKPHIAGYGEAGLFRGLSEDDTPDFEEILDRSCQSINDIDISSVPSSAIRMGLETALSDLVNGGKHQPFTTGVITPIHINGLIWMGNKDFMLNEIEHKINHGFRCLKLKIGGIDFESELEILKTIRNRFSSDILTLRLDANGAFQSDNALQRLEKLSTYDIHSIEQPIKQGQISAIAHICRNSPIPIALDEELIGIKSDGEKEKLLDVIRPDFIILKPTMCGGFNEADIWIKQATKRGIGWWATSALESNIGLNAIARWTIKHDVSLPQGLGTGQLYVNNITSPLMMQGETLTSNLDEEWNMSLTGL